ncbi:MAG: hypothetical protein U1F71_17610 [Verrucomicrobiaceae bacterium]
MIGRISMKMTRLALSRTAIVLLSAWLFLVGSTTCNAWISCGPRPIILPEVRFKDATLEEAVAYLKQAVKKLGLFASENINVVVIGASAEQKRKKISLDVGEISLLSAFEHIANTVGLKVRVEAHAVVLISSSRADELATRIYRVPPDFMQTGSAVR